MTKGLHRIVSKLLPEEKFLFVGSLITVIGVCLPWVGGEWLGGDTVSHSGFGFYTGFLGSIVFLVQIANLIIGLSPVSGGPQILKKSSTEHWYFYSTSVSTILILSSLSVITRTTLEFTRMEIRFGLYVALIGTLMANLYGYLLRKDKLKKDVQGLFHQEEQKGSIPRAPRIESHHPHKS